MTLLDISRWWWDYFLLATPLLVLLICFGWIVRQPARRIALAWATAFGLFALAIFCAMSREQKVHLLPPAPPKPQWTQELQPVLGPFIQRSELQRPPAVAPAEENGKSTVAVPSQITVIDTGLIVTTVLITGSLLIGAWMLVGMLQVHRLCRRAGAAPREVVALLKSMAKDETTPRLGMVDALPVAVACGLIKPTILIPSMLSEAKNPVKLRDVLAHELAHVQHRDLWLLALLRLLMLTLWPHPLYWIWRQRVRLDQELLADTVAAELTSRNTYAEQLVALARQARDRRTPRLATSVGLWETRSQLAKRIAVLLDEKFAVLRNCSRGWWIGSLLIAAICTLVLSTLTLAPQTAESKVVGLASTTGTIEQLVSSEEFQELVSQSETRKGFADAVGELVAQAIQSTQLPFVTEEELERVRMEFFSLVANSGPDNLDASRKEKLLSALRDGARAHMRLPFAPRADKRALNLAYLNFSDRVKTLEWELWMALMRTPPAGAELQERAAQREWMRQLVHTQPADRFVTHQQELDRLETLFDDPLCAVFAQPMPAKAFEKFCREIEAWIAKTPHGEAGTMPSSTQVVNRLEPYSPLRHLVFHLHIEALYAQWQGERGRALFPSFDDDAIVSYGSSGGYLNLGFESHRNFVSSSRSIDSIEQGGQWIDAATGYLTSAADEANGDFGFSDKNMGLVARGNAKLLLLDAESWHEADQISTGDLRKKIAEHGTDRIDLAEYCRERQIWLPDLLTNDVGPYVGVLANDGQVAVVHVEDVTLQSHNSSIALRTRARSSLENNGQNVAVSTETSDPSSLTGNLAPSVPPADSEEQDELEDRSGGTQPSTPTSTQDDRSTSQNAEDVSDEAPQRLGRTAPEILALRKPNTIVGVCLDENHTPLAGVKVGVYSAKYAKFGSGQRETQKILTAQTDSAGRFRFVNVVDVAREFPDGFPEANFGPRHPKVLFTIARTQGRTPGVTTDLASQVAQRGAVAILRMQTAQTLRGRIVDDQHRPVAGARVGDGVGYWATNAGIPGNINAAMTNQDGEYVIDDLEAYDAEQAKAAFEKRANSEAGLSTYAGVDKPWERTLLVTHPDYAVRRAVINRIPGRVDVTLQPGAVLAGQVLKQPADKPAETAANAEVTLLRQPQAGEKRQFSFQSAQALTDAQGRYHFESLPPGKYALAVNAEGWVTLGKEGIDVQRGKNASAPEIVLTPGGKVRIQIVDDETGEPITFSEPRKGYVMPQVRPRRLSFYFRSPVVEFSKEGIGEQQLPPGEYLLVVTFPPTEQRPGWEDAEYANVRSVEDLNKLPTIRVQEGEILKITKRLAVPAGEALKATVTVAAGPPSEEEPPSTPAKPMQRSDFVPATPPAESTE